MFCHQMNYRKTKTKFKHLLLLLSNVFQVDVLFFISATIRTYCPVLPIHSPREPSNSIPSLSPTQRPQSNKQHLLLLLYYSTAGDSQGLRPALTMKCRFLTMAYVARCTPAFLKTSLALPRSWSSFYSLEHIQLFPTHSLWFSCPPFQHALQSFSKVGYQQSLGLGSDVISSGRLSLSRLSR